VLRFVSTESAATVSSLPRECLSVFPFRLPDADLRSAFTIGGGNAPFVSELFLIGALGQNDLIF